MLAQLAGHRATGGAARRRHDARTEQRALGDVAETAAALAIVGAGVTGLHAERDRGIAQPVRIAEAATTLGVIGARVTGRLAAVAERRTRAVLAETTTALAIVAAGLAVRGALLIATHEVDTRERAAVRTGAALFSGGDARSGDARAQPGGVITVADAAFGVVGTCETGLDARRTDRIAVVVAAGSDQRQDEDKFFHVCPSGSQPL